MDYDTALKKYLRELDKRKDKFWLDSKQEELKYIEHNSDRFISAIKILDSYITNNKNNSFSILDIGTSPLTLILRYMYPTLQITTVDLTDRFKNICEENNIIFLKKDLNKDYNFGSKKYDIVLFLEVIEHLELNHKSLIDSILTSLKKGGHCIIQTPNKNSLKRVLANNLPQNILNRVSTDPEVSEEFKHQKEYTHTELENLVKDIKNTKIVSSKIPMYFDTYKASMAYRKKSIVSTIMIFLLYITSLVLFPFRRGLQVVFKKI